VLHCDAIPAENIHEPQSIYHPETVYFLQLLLQGTLKTAENRDKIAKNTRFDIPPFVLQPIGHFGEMFYIGAQLHLFRYRMASNVCAKVQALS